MFGSRKCQPHSFALFYFSYINYNLINLIDIIIFDLTKNKSEEKIIMWKNIMYNIKKICGKI